MAGPIGSALIGVAFIATLASNGMRHDDRRRGARITALFAVAAAGDDVAVNFGLQWDRISLIWTLIITGVGFLIHVYSIGYMAGDNGFARFFAYMNFFVFAMLTLVLSDNFVGLLVGWGLVGLASYFLIGYYFERPSAVAAARKAFVINVVGDIGILYAVVRDRGQGRRDRLRRRVLARGASSRRASCSSVCLALFIGCAAKSAQVPLHTWLPDAMEGPTPVSALIHAATMVTAGVYLIARCAPLWNASSDARVLVGSIGALTAITGAILGCAQWDIKRILAYSTMSQIGYMIMGVGVGAYDAGILHFFTHAFFKAQLFLGAGIIIHNLANEQDVRLMGGLRKQMPFAFAGDADRRALDLRHPRLQRILQQGRGLERDARARPSRSCGRSACSPPASPRTTCSGCSSSRSSARIAATSIRASSGLRHPELAGTAHGAAGRRSLARITHHAPAWLIMSWAGRDR